MLSATPGHLLIVDALNLIRRIDAVQQKQQHASTRQRATLAQCERTINKLLAHFSPSHVVAVFDGQQPGWRQQLFPAYKQGRPPMDPALLRALNEIQQCWWEQGVDSLLSERDEADDLIATLASKAARHGMPATIISTDQGYCQLLAQPRIQLYDHFRQAFLDANWVQARFGVSAALLPELWGLSGLRSTGIPGVRGIGPKGARTILQQGFRLANWPDTTALAEKYHHKLAQEIDQARLSTRLATLRSDIPLGFNLKEIRYSPPANTSLAPYPSGGHR